MLVNVQLNIALKVSICPLYLPTPFSSLDITSDEQVMVIMLP